MHSDIYTMQPAWRATSAYMRLENDDPGKSQGCIVSAGGLCSGTMCKSGLHGVICNVPLRLAMVIVFNAKERWANVDLSTKICGLD